MFPNKIGQTDLTKIGAPQRGVCGDNVIDSVFVSVLRAILPSRMGEDTLRVHFSCMDITDWHCDQHESECILDFVYSYSVGCANSISVINMKFMDKLNKKSYDGFEAKYDGWYRVQKLTTFYKRHFDVACFVNPDLKSSILVVGRANASKVHHLTATLPAYMPWYFGGGNSMSKEEFDLLDSLRKQTDDAFLAALQKFTDGRD